METYRDNDGSEKLERPPLDFLSAEGVKNAGLKRYDVAMATRGLFVEDKSCV